MILLLALLLISSSEALEVKNLSLDYGKFLKEPRLLELPKSKAIETLALNLDINIVGPLYFDNVISLIGTKNQVEWVSWLFSIGAEVGGLDLYVKHRSQHTLDTPHPYSRFPVENSAGVTINIMGKKR